MSSLLATGLQNSLLPLLRTQLGSSYHFTPLTPLRHQRVLTRRTTSGRGESPSLQDIFGWKPPFRAGTITPGMMAQMAQAGVVTTLPPVTSGSDNALLHSTVRVSSLGDDLFFHSAYPTVQSDAVFFRARHVSICPFHRPYPHATGRAIPAARRAGRDADSRHRLRKRRWRYRRSADHQVGQRTDAQ